jgi:hypothetical protein
MNLCLHYEVGHKTVLKSIDQAKSNPKQTVKYNLSKAKKTPKAGIAVKENTIGDGACNTLAATGQAPATA